MCRTNCYIQFLIRQQCTIVIGYKFLDGDWKAIYELEIIKFPKTDNPPSQCDEPGFRIFTASYRFGTGHDRDMYHYFERDVLFFLRVTRGTQRNFDKTVHPTIHFFCSTTHTYTRSLFTFHNRKCSIDIHGPWFSSRMF